MAFGSTFLTQLVCIVSVLTFSGMCNAEDNSEPAAVRGPVPWAIPGEMTAERVELLHRASAYAHDLVPKAAVRATSRSGRELIDALWVDWGDPIVNYDYQDIVIGLVADLDILVPRDAAEGGAFRRALRDGLVEFYYSGGMNSPEISIAAQNFAQAMLQVSEPGDVEVTAIIANVALAVAESGRQIRANPDEAAALAAHLGVTPETLARLWEASGDAFRRRLKSFLAGTAQSDISETIQRALTADSEAVIAGARDAVAQLEWHEGAPITAELARDSACSQPDSTPGARDRFREWFDGLRRVTRDADPARAQLERLARALEQGFGDPEIDRQAQRALLIAYRRILESRSPRPKAEIVRAIEEDLVRIGRSETTDDRTRRLWAQAVLALGQRASDRVVEIIEVRIAQEADRKTRSVLEAARSRIQRASRHGPAP
jgi:hypothetical protein